MIDMGLNIDSIILEFKKKKLIAADYEFQNLWDLICSLNDDEFLLLKSNKYFSKILKSIQLENNEKQAKKENGSNNNVNLGDLPHPNTLLNDLYFYNSFDKLIIKIRNSITNSSNMTNLGEDITLKGILELSLNDFSLLPSIGVRYVKLWKELKKIYSQEKVGYTRPSKQRSLEMSFDNMDLNYSFLSTTEQKNVEKFKRLNPKLKLKDFVLFNDQQFDGVSGVGKKFIETIDNLKGKLVEELVQIQNESIDYKKWEGKYIIPINHDVMPLKELSHFILEDIDNFLDKISPEKQDIFQSRWGFVEELMILEDLGKKYGQTRESIRLKEVELNSLLKLSLRMKPEGIWTSIKSQMRFDLSDKMADLSSCFGDNKNFYAFIEYICGEKEILDVIKPNKEMPLLNYYFANHGVAKQRKEIMEYFESNLLLDDDIDVINFIDYAFEKKFIRLDNGKIYPCCLTRNEAAASVLVEHKNGLPWLDIATIVNNFNLAKGTFVLHRKDQGSLFDSELTFLAGKGIYKHTNFLNLEKINVEAIFDSILEFFDSTNRVVFHLNEVYKNSINLQSESYYVVRYIVKIFGEEYGFFFSGKSQSDSISVNKKFKNITQKDVILEALKISNKPLTKVEIADFLKSKSIAHATLYIDGLANEAKIVQIDRMLYTLPDIAYKDIEIDKYISAIKDILLDEGKPVEPSIFEEKLNNLFNETYSKYFYASIARFVLKQESWYKSHNLYSVSEIPYKNLMDVCDVHCQLELNNIDNYNALSKFIAIKRDKAISSIIVWKKRNKEE
jgi:hypothetical protein